MTLRQQVLKWIYPLWMLYARITGKHFMNVRNRPSWEPPASIYDLSFTTTDGREYSLDNCRGKKILFVNTASDCVYTSQYAEMQELQEKLGHLVQVFAFPSNEFKAQEQKENKEIASFCSKNFGVKFPIAEKSMVRRRMGQHPVYQWLTHAEKNGWNDRPPFWNFSKYLVNENGVLTHAFGPTITPMSKKMISVIRG